MLWNRRRRGFGFGRGDQDLDILIEGETESGVHMFRLGTGQQPMQEWYSVLLFSRILPFFPRVPFPPACCCVLGAEPTTGSTKSSGVKML